MGWKQKVGKQLEERERDRMGANVDYSFSVTQVNDPERPVGSASRSSTRMYGQKHLAARPPAKPVFRA